MAQFVAKQGFRHGNHKHSRNQSNKPTNVEPLDSDDGVHD
jgi:hypothetical protein